jgi:hypothetical protein
MGHNNNILYDISLDSRRARIPVLRNRLKMPQEPESVVLPVHLILFPVLDAVPMLDYDHRCTGTAYRIGIS